VGKYNIDDILNELGMEGEEPGKPGAGGDTAGKATPKYGATPDKPAANGMNGTNVSNTAKSADTSDKALVKRASKPKASDEPHEISPLPMMPSHQSPLSLQPGANPPESRALSVKHGAGVNEIYRPESSAASGDRAEQVAERLRANNALADDKIVTALALIKKTPNRSMADLFVEQGADEAAVSQAIAEVERTPFERIDLTKGLDGGFDGRMLQRLTPDFCKEQMAIPLRTEGSRAIVGTTQPNNLRLLDEIKERLGVPSVKLVMVPAFDVKGALEIIGVTDTTQVPEEDLSKLLSEVDESDVQVEQKSDQTNDLEKEAGESPVIRYVNHIIQKAIQEGASDIHIEPSEKKLKVRFRIDGELYEMMQPPASMGAAIVSRLKIMANLDISERRLPQDGRIRCQVAGRKLDLRMSTLPVNYGEKVVMRILDSKSISVELEQLGFDPDQYVIWRKQIDSPHGIILVTGPTGSGKTTTLYASLRKLDKESMNICTVEDPIEYHLDGVTQSQMHEKIGMTFGLALRALLRQDPDVVMLGEIRDMETAHIAVQAALTGHLVLSTLHTNDAPSSITRLVNIGLEPFLVGAAVNAVLAQRLIRKLCKDCKAKGQPSEDLLDFLQMQGLPTNEIWVAKGCEKCRRNGYSGRIGIYEQLVVDDQLRDVIARNPNVSEFRRMCIERGMVTLRSDGLKKTATGITTIQEVLRVTEAHY
jgi:type IV pilus assembly protein PilB